MTASERRVRERYPMAVCFKVRGEVCCHCGQPGATIPHHDLSTGAGGRDEDTIPLLQDPCHLRLHQLGDVQFWQEAGIEPLVAVEAMRDWVAAGCPQGQMPFSGRK